MQNSFNRKPNQIKPSGLRLLLPAWLRARVDDPHGHPAEPIIDPSLAKDRPPIIEKVSVRHIATHPPITRLSRNTVASGPSLIKREIDAEPASATARKARPMTRLIQPRRRS
jgi:hypothetical protein